MEDRKDTLELAEDLAKDVLELSATTALTVQSGNIETTSGRCGIKSSESRRGIKASENS